MRSKTPKSLNSIGIGVVSALLCLLCGALGNEAHSQALYKLNKDRWSGERQFLNKEYFPLWEERYENYSLLSYRDYGFREDRPTYDPFGTYLLDGADLLRVEEYRTLAPTRSSRINRSGLIEQRFNRNLIIMRDHYQGWSNRIMFGDALEAHFTPLVQTRARFQGLRWDGSSYKNRFSFVTSRVPERIVSGQDDLPFAGYLYGGHWESHLGDIVTFGASYVNLHLRDSMQRKGDFRGAFPNRLEGTPAYYVIVSDDSPADSDGVRVFDVEVYANGEKLDVRPQISRIGNIVDAVHVPHVRRDGAWAPQSMESARLLEDRRGLFFREGEEILPGPDPLEVGGTDLLVYRYEIPESTENLQFKVLSAGDYSIDLAAAYTFTGASAQWVDWHNVERARGNVVDGSNKDWVSAEYGFPTGITQYGSTVEVQLLGMRLDAEMINNVQNFQFSLLGDHHDRATQAYFVKLLKEEKTWEFGAEYFDVPSTYQTSLPIWSESAQKPLTYDLVEDNDDRDEWPDKYEHWDPLDPVFLSFRAAGSDVDNQLPQTSRDYGYTGRGSSYGVFPGLDRDEDGVVDTNVNQNQFPDYSEPFLMYYVERDEFVYGDDFNNNGMVDARENDNKPDYPYDLDTRGFHGFVSFNPAERLGVRLGRYDIRQTAGDGESGVNYAEFEYSTSAPKWGRLSVNYRIKRIRDDIPNPVYRHEVEPLSQALVGIRLRPDPLFMQNSLLNTLFVKGRYTGRRNLNLIGTAKYERNDLRDQGDDISDWTLVSKADYAYPIGNWTLTPMVKFAVERRTAPSDLLSSLETYELFPILKAEYALSPRTTLRAGVQGLPRFDHTFRNKEAALEDFDARHYVVAVQNTGNQRGYDLSINVGFRSSRSKFVNLPSRRVQKFTEFFIQARVL